MPSRHHIMYIVGDGGSKGYDRFYGELWNAGNLSGREVGQYYDVYWARKPFWNRDINVCGRAMWVYRRKVFFEFATDRLYWANRKPYGTWTGEKWVPKGKIVWSR